VTRDITLFDAILRVHAELLDAV